MNARLQKKLRDLLYVVSREPPQQRLALLRAAWQLENQKQVDAAIAEQMSAMRC